MLNNTQTPSAATDVAEFISDLDGGVFERLRAPDAEQAARNARVVFNLPVHRVERLEEVAA